LKFRDALAVTLQPLAFASEHLDEMCPPLIWIDTCHWQAGYKQGIECGLFVTARGFEHDLVRVLWQQAGRELAKASGTVGELAHLS